jgi:multidrug efflux system membrane fusion protein
MTVKRKAILLVTIGVFAGAIIWQQLSQHKAREAHKQAIPVEVTVVQRKDLEQTIQAVATVQASATVAIKSQVNGTLAQVNFQEGQEVQVNDVLFHIDDKPFAIAVQQAKADLAKDQVQLDNAKVQLQRYSKLIGKGFVSQDIYNQAQSNVSSFNAAVAASQAKLAAAQLQLDYCTIRAPISGRTGNIVVQPGNLVKENDATALVVINQINPIVINFAVPEQYLPAIQRSLAQGLVALTAQVTHEVIEQGQLTSINNEIDTVTGTIKLKGTFANDSDRLWPGQYVTVVLPIAKLQAALVVPSRAIQQGQKGSYVYVVDKEQKAEYRPITTGLRVKSETVVLKGLSAGETVVVDGQFRLTHGIEVSTGPVSK